MKAYISNYRHHWISPYTILTRVCFWEKDPDRIYNLEDQANNPYTKWVERLTPWCEALRRVLDWVHPQIQYVRIDPWDTYSMDATLGHIVLPMLRQLYISKHGSPHVADEDVPEHLRSTAAPPPENDWDTDANHHARWDWVMEEMIFAFEHSQDTSWQDRFSSGVIDRKNVPCAWDANGQPTLYEWVEGPNHTYHCDREGMKRIEDRMQRGFELFGKYYQALWD